MTARSPKPHSGSSRAPRRSAARLVTQARRHFFLHGFRSVTMDDLAQELGVSKKTLYTQYPSKHALLEAVVRDKFAHVEADLAEISSAPAQDLFVRLRQLLECMQRHFDEVQPPFVRDVQRGEPEIFQLIQSLRSKHIQQYFGTCFDQARRSGLIRKDVPPNVVIELLLGAVEAIMNPVQLEALNLTPKAAFTAIVKTILEGALTEKGRRR